MKPLLLSVIVLGTGAFMFGCKTGQKQTAPAKAKQEQHRPQFHFTPREMWMNDPNGLVYYDGEYHLFYQHYPDSTVWGPMHWGHAVSKDLVHWEHLPIALAPDSLGYIFSGSVVVDSLNTAGFQAGKEKTLVAIFTYHNMAFEKQGRLDRQYQAIAYSNDKGRTWTKYAGNPVIKSPGTPDFRDPKVIWHAPSSSWVMTLAAGNHIEFFTSPDLKNWTRSGTFGEKAGAHGGVWECPDLFPLSVPGSDQQKWVLLVSIGDSAVNGGSGTQYFIGDFDGKTFRNNGTDSSMLWLDYGRDNYAGVTWFGAPNNQRLFLGWMSNWKYAKVVPTKSWRSAMTWPRQLQLVATDSGLRVASVPLDIESLHDGIAEIHELKQLDGQEQLSTHGALREIWLEADLSKISGTEIGIRLSNSKGEFVTMGFDLASHQYFFDRTNSGKKNFEPGFAGRYQAPRWMQGNKLSLHLLVDVASAEMFADDGLTTLTNIFFPNEDYQRLSVYTKGGEAKDVLIRIQPLKPAVPQ